MAQVDYAKLAAEAGGVAVQAPPAGAVPADGPDYAAMAKSLGGEPVVFRANNATDEQGHSIVDPDPNTAGTYFRHVWAGINPAQLGQLLPFPKALGGSGMDHPALTVISKALEVKQEADRRWEKGDHVGATAKYVESLIPILGPMMSHWGDELETGKYAAAAGDVTGFALAPKAWELGGRVAAAGADAGARAVGILPPKAAPAPAGAGTISTLTPEEAAANAFAESRGIPLDAATKTGNPFLRGVQKVTGESLIGAPVIAKARTAQNTAMARVGGELADEVRPGASTSPEAAGGSVTEGIRSLMADLHDMAGRAYDKVRAAEASAEPDTVPVKENPVDVTARETRQHNSIGYVPSEAAISELRRIKLEMETHGFTPTRWRNVAGDEGTAAETGGGRGLQGNAGGGAWDRTPGSAGAPVYNDIVDAMPGEGVSKPTRGEVIHAIDAALETGHFSTVSKGALSVAERRARGQMGGLSKPTMAPGSADVPGATQEMQLAVDLRDVKGAIRPIYDRLNADNSVAPLQGGKAESLRALSRLINGPDHVPLTIAEDALGDLKSLARSDDPLVRGAAKGIAAKAVGELSDAVKMRAGVAGDEVYGALQEGRAATKAKYAASDVLDQLRDEPVRLFDQLTAPRDTAIDLLRKVQELAPAKMAEVGRAKLESWIERATERSRFDHGDALFGEWQKLGPETKKLLFGENVENIDKFMLTAKRLGENPNPSGTAGTIVKYGEVTAPLTALFSGNLPAAAGSAGISLTSGAIAKLLYSPRGVKALTRLLETNGKAQTAAAAGKPIGQAAQSAAWLDVAAAAKAAGVPLTVPQAADSRDQRAKR